MGIRFLPALLLSQVLEGIRDPFPSVQLPPGTPGDSTRDPDSEDHLLLLLQSLSDVQHPQCKTRYRVDTREESKLLTLPVGDLVFLQITTGCMAGKQINRMSNEFKFSLI